MVEIGKIRIKKKTYQFEVKKKFQHLGHYKVKVRPPIERIKDQIRDLLTPKKQEKKATAVTSAPSPGGFNFAVLGAAILIAIIILALGWLYLTTQVLQLQAGVFQPQLEKPVIYNTILSGDILTSGERGTEEHIAAVLVDYKTQNLVNYTIKLTTYNDKLPSQVFVLNSEKFEATTYSDFLRTLRVNLAKRKILLNEINVKQLETIPQGAIVIVPSGVIPKEMLGVDSTLTMDKLADRGVVVIYIGQPFTKMLNETLVVSTPQNTVKNLPVGFDETSPLSTSSDFHLFQPLYRALSRSGLWQGDTIYGSVTVLKNGNGAFIFIPQTLDGGWRGNFTSAAEDISKIVFDSPWSESNAQTKVYEFANETNYSGTRYFFSEPFTGTRSSVKVEFVGYSATSPFPIQETLITYLEKVPSGELFIEQGVKVVPTNITNTLARLNAKLQEPTAAQPSMFLIITDINGTEVQNFAQGNVNVQAEKSFDIPIYTDRGEYIVKLVDDESKVYAQTYMGVVSIDITSDFSTPPRKRSEYNFAVTMAGSPIILKDVKVTVDNGQYGTYEFKDISKIRVDVGKFTGDEPLPFGVHNFDFVAGGLKVNFQIENKRPETIFTNPFFLLVLVLTVVIVGVGAVFARQESIYYSIDIPDFPPVARTKVPLSPDVVLSIFSKVNETYRWQNTPLTAAELKNGFKDIFYKGRPVYVTDYNVEYLLEELEKKRLITESMGYYGIAEWEKKTKRTINYVAMMRRLRDICVNNAIPFTGLGESGVADSEVTVVGQQMFLHFYEKDADLKTTFKKILTTIGKGINIILFKNQVDKAAFQTLIHSPSVAPLILKLETDSGSIQLLTLDEFEKMVIEFKTM